MISKVKEALKPFIQMISRSGHESMIDLCVDRIL